MSVWERELSKGYRTQEWGRWEGQTGTPRQADRPGGAGGARRAAGCGQAIRGAPGHPWSTWALLPATLPLAFRFCLGLSDQLLPAGAPWGL